MTYPLQLYSTAYNAGGAVVYASERNMGNYAGNRLHAISLDGGKTFAGEPTGMPLFEINTIPTTRS